ncbi:lipoprotein LpqH [Gordonia sp. ABSL1-1]|uniref:lipoprotein LpqH n=1 Tax=Gordonia sp. ABSL1-1 TaxID=3053923 RepID=UPI0025731AFE|nr:lipoprotein LpqH [Gordonia sp. ABSL1-1]MDL9936756.1 lipoprotein LpqH [Gordonia sp. ABSL1-1]
MKRMMQAVSVIGAVGIAFAVAGCSDDDNDSSGGSPASGDASVSLGGEPVQLTDNKVACVSNGGNVNIAVGSQTGRAGIGAVVTEGDNPEVVSVGIAATNGILYGYAKAAPGANASATKDGSTYTLTGQLTGIDPANPTQQLTKPFEMKVTCP